jgi:hypothetical protein
MRCGACPGIVAVLLLGLVGFGLREFSSAGAQGTALVKLDPPARTVDYASGNFAIDVLIEAAPEVAAFEFALEFDAAILGYVDVSEGPFLAKTGRRLLCPSPVIDVGYVRFGCATSGTTPVPASGSGVLGTVTFRPKASGRSDVDFVGTQLADVLGDNVPSSQQGGSVTVRGGPAPAPTPSPAPGEPTPTPRIGPGTPVPVGPAAPTPYGPPSSAPAAQGPPGVSGAAGGVPGDASTDDLPGSGAGGTEAESGVFPGAGTGSLEDEGDAAPVIAALCLAVTGAAILAVGARYARRTVSAR